MGNQISHAGIVDSITEGMVHVRILQSSACSSCKVAQHCTSAESKEKIIDVPCADAGRYRIGDEVTVMAANSVGMKAVLLAFVIPSVLLLATIAVLLALGYTELTAALSGIGILIPYFIFIYMIRQKLEKILTFYIK